MKNFIMFLLILLTGVVVKESPRRAKKVELQPDKPVVALELRTKIGIVDTGLNVDKYTKPFLCKDVAPFSSIDNDPDHDSPFPHGTNIASLIIQNLDVRKHCIFSVKAIRENGGGGLGSVLEEVEGIRYAVKSGAKFINMSFHGRGFLSEEYEIIAWAIRRGVSFSVAAGNSDGYAIARDFDNERVKKLNSNGKPILDCSDSKVCKYQYEIIPSGADLDKECDVYPACYIFNTKYFHVVGSSEGSINRWGGIDNYGNYGSRVQFLEPGTMRGTPEMTGTSQSTAIHTGKWAAGLIP